MPLTTVPLPRLALLLRSGMLLGKVVARLAPGTFDTLCLRSKGGEVSWQQNITHIWQACPFLGTPLRVALEAGDEQAAWASLHQVTLHALEPRARKACGSWLGARSTDWPLRAVLFAWVEQQRTGAGEWLDRGADSVKKPNAAAVRAALVSAGVVRAHGGGGGRRKKSCLC